MLLKRFLNDDAEKVQQWGTKKVTKYTHFISQVLKCLEKS